MAGFAISSSITNAAESIQAAGYDSVHTAGAVTVADPWGTPVRILASQ